MIELNKIYHSDNIKILKEIDTDFVDMVFADPPFNVGKKYGNNKDKKDDYYKWCESWIKECFRILKPTGTFYHMTIPRHLEILMPMMAKYGVFISQIIWKNVSASHDKRRFWMQYQPILMYGKTEEYKFNHLAETRITQFSWNMKRKENQKGQLTDYWDDIPFVYAGSIKHKEAIIKPGTNQKAHIAQMPENLVARAMKFSTQENDIVVDPFSGSGTTAAVCQKLNRTFIVIDDQKEYVKLSEKRINDFEPLFKQPGLVAPEIG